MSEHRLSIRDVTGCTLVRFETADGMRVNVDDDEAARRITSGGVNFRALPPEAIGPEIERYLYAILRLDEARFVFDLPRSLYGGRSAGDKSGTVHLRALGKNSPPVGTVYFLTRDRRFREGDPEDRGNFEALR
jgi:hypothetical protein